MMFSLINLLLPILTLLLCLPSTLAVQATELPKPPSTSSLLDTKLCTDPGLLNWPLCDSVVDGDTPALKSDIETGAIALLAQHVKWHFDLPACHCCTISLPLLPFNLTRSTPPSPRELYPPPDPNARAFLKVCNARVPPINAPKSNPTTQIPWSLVGMVAHNLANSRCSRPPHAVDTGRYNPHNGPGHSDGWSDTEFNGYFTWTSTSQTWTLFVVGPGSSQVDDWRMPVCSALVPVRKVDAGESKGKGDGREERKGHSDGLLVGGNGTVVLGNGNETESVAFGNATNGTLMVSSSAVRRRTLKLHKLPYHTWSYT